MVDISGTGTCYSSGALVFIPSFNGVPVAQSLVFCVLLCRLLFVLLYLFLGHCIVYPAIYGFWVYLWYLQTLLTKHKIYNSSSLEFRITSVTLTDEPVIERRVWRYQRCNQNPYIKELQTTQWSKETVQ